MQITLIVAADEAGAIGYQNRLLCHLPADLRHFKQLTTGHHLLMGRKTYESIGRPLPGRTMLVLSSNPHFQAAGCMCFTSIAQAIDTAAQNGEEELFVTGGADIFRQLLPNADCVQLTRIHHCFQPADTWFQPLDHRWQLTSRIRHSADDKNPFDYSFELWQPASHLLG